MLDRVKSTVFMIIFSQRTAVMISLFELCLSANQHDMHSISPLYLLSDAIYCV